MTERWTVRRMLTWMAEDFSARRLASPRLDAELLVAHALGCDRVALYLDLDRPLDGAELEAIRALVKRRRAHEPVAYILGAREFVGRRFEVGPAVLIPRPDTETLVERALALLPAEADTRVLDLCTGTGCIAVTLAAERPRCVVQATDISQPALEVAARNAERHGVADRVQLHHGDLWAAVAGLGDYDLVVGNPPYVTESEWGGLQADVRDHEPRIALVAGPDGLDCYRAIAARLVAHLRPGGHALFEVGAGQAGAVHALLAGAGLVEPATHADLGGIERVVEACRPPG